MPVLEELELEAGSELQPPGRERGDWFLKKEGRTLVAHETVKVYVVDHIECVDPNRDHFALLLFILAQVEVARYSQIEICIAGSLQAVARHSIETLVREARVKWV